MPGGASRFNATYRISPSNPELKLLADVLMRHSLCILEISGSFRNSSERMNVKMLLLKAVNH
jgi:hypothetical protein